MLVLGHSMRTLKHPMRTSKRSMRTLHHPMRMATKKGEAILKIASPFIFV